MSFQDDPNSLTTESEEENDYQKENSVIKENIAIIKRNIIDNNSIIRLFNKSKEDNLRLNNELASLKSLLDSQNVIIENFKLKELEIENLKTQLRNSSTSIAYLKAKLEEKTKSIQEPEAPSPQKKSLEHTPLNPRSSKMTLAMLLKEIPSPAVKRSKASNHSLKSATENGPSHSLSTELPSPSSPEPLETTHLLHSDVANQDSPQFASTLLPEGVMELLTNALNFQYSHFIDQKQRLVASKFLNRWKYIVTRSKLDIIQENEKQLGNSKDDNSHNCRENRFNQNSTIACLENKPSEKMIEDYHRLIEENKSLASKIQVVEEEQISLIKIISRLNAEKPKAKVTISVGTSMNAISIVDASCQTDIEPALNSKVASVSEVLIMPLESSDASNTPSSQADMGSEKKEKLDLPEEREEKIIPNARKRLQPETNSLLSPILTRKRLKRLTENKIEDKKCETPEDEIERVAFKNDATDKKALRLKMAPIESISNEPPIKPVEKEKGKLIVRLKPKGELITRLPSPKMEPTILEPESPPTSPEDSSLKPLSFFEGSENFTITPNSTSLPDLSTMEGVIQCAYDLPLYFLTNLSVARETLVHQPVHLFIQALLQRIQELQKNVQWTFSGEEGATAPSLFDQRYQFLQPSGRIHAFKLPDCGVSTVHFDAALPLHEQTALILLSLVSSDSSRWTRALCEASRTSICAFRLYILSPHASLVSIRIFLVDLLITKSRLLISYLSQLISFRSEVLDASIPSSELKDPLAFMIRFSLCKQLKHFFISFQKSLVPTFVHQWLSQHVFNMADTIHAFPLTSIAQITDPNHLGFLLMKCTQLYISACISVVEKHELLSLFLSKGMHQLPLGPLLDALDLILQRFDSYWKPTSSDLEELEKLVKLCPASESTKIKSVLTHLNKGNPKLASSLFAAIPH